MSSGIGKSRVSLSSSCLTRSAQNTASSSAAVIGLPVPGLTRGAGFFFMSARTLYQALGISDSSR